MQPFRKLVLAATALASSAWLARRYAPAGVERIINRVLLPPPYPPLSPQAQALHTRAFIADLHADTLVTGRDLLQRASRGHVDLPRLQQANVAFQVFGLVTKTPLGMNVQLTRENLDMLTGMLILSGWPRSTWGSLLERALYQCARLRAFAARSAGSLMLVSNLQDLQTLLERRSAREQVTGAFCGLEGAHALQGNLDNLERLYEAGTRMLGLTHFFDNAAGGSAHGLSGAGLSNFGRQLVGMAQARGMLVDLAHASPRMIYDTLKATSAPLVVSHTGVRATLDSPRNLDDDQIRSIAATGGVIGIALFQTALGGNDISATARAMRHVAQIAGVDCLAIGSDFDGGVTTFTDVSGLPSLTDELLRVGFSPDEVLQILGGNFLRVLTQTLPRQA